MQTRFFIAMVMTAVLFAPGLSITEMSSTSYRITTTVMSGGGGSMASDNFQINGTLGQPSPLIDPAAPPWSTSYDLLTGFWYTLGAGMGGCWYDYEPDGDVDGSDLATFATASPLGDLETFLLEFGSTDCMN